MISKNYLKSKLKKIKIYKKREERERSKRGRTSWNTKGDSIEGSRCFKKAKKRKRKYWGINAQLSWISYRENKNRNVGNEYLNDRFNY